MKVVKRDGKIVDFNSEKIKQALIKSAARTGEMLISDIRRITEIVVNKCERSSGDTIGVEEIQDLVEKGLMSTKKAERLLDIIDKQLDELSEDRLVQMEVLDVLEKLQKQIEKMIMKKELDMLNY